MGRALGSGSDARAVYLARALTTGSYITQDVAYELCRRHGAGYTANATSARWLAMMQDGSYAKVFLLEVSAAGGTLLLRALNTGYATASSVGGTCAAVDPYYPASFTLRSGVYMADG